jgi:hypothetical protein
MIGRTVLVLLFLLLPHHPAHSQSKTDILGYFVGMSEKQLMAKLAEDRISCRTIRKSMDDNWDSACDGTNSRINGKLTIRFTAHLPERKVLALHFFFISTTQKEDMFKSLIDQYKPLKINDWPVNDPRAMRDLTYGDTLTLLLSNNIHFSATKPDGLSVPNSWYLEIYGRQVGREDEAARDNNIRRNSESPRRF